MDGRFSGTYVQRPKKIRKHRKSDLVSRVTSPDVRIFCKIRFLPVAESQRSNNAGKVTVVDAILLLYYHGKLILFKVNT